MLSVESFADLPRALIRARIAARLSQEQLAERLGLKEQQVQQYEATEYAAASVTRIRQVIDALGVQVREDVFLPSSDLSPAHLFRRMEEVGVGREFIINRLLPRPLAARLGDIGKTASGEQSGPLVLQAASAIGKVYDLTPAAIFGASPLRLNTSAVGSARFKLPAKADERRMTAYTVYAHYLALLTADAARHLERKPVPTDAAGMRQEILSQFGSFTFENALRYAWGLGVAVLPLADPANFHGAFWRVDQRNVVVLKQRARYPARWLNDLIHELYHAGQEPGQPERSVIEEEDILQNRQESEEEEDARYFAEDAVFDGRADEIAKKCARRAGKDTRRLKSVLPVVAAEEGVLADALAYFMAYRMAEDGTDWWGAATNLQDTSIDPWRLARDVFLERANLGVLNPADRSLLAQALMDEE